MLDVQKNRSTPWIVFSGEDRLCVFSDANPFCFSQEAITLCQA